MTVAESMNVCGQSLPERDRVRDSNQRNRRAAFDSSSARSTRRRDGEAALDSAFELHDDRTNVGLMYPTFADTVHSRRSVTRDTANPRLTIFTPRKLGFEDSAQPTECSPAVARLARRLAGPVIDDPPVFTFVITR